MAFKFRCPACGKRLTVEESPGAQTTCPHCNQAVTVPADAVGSEAAGAAEAGPEIELAAVASATAAQGAPAQPEGEQQPEEPQTGMDNVMGWLALYLPSWGTSFILHVVIVVLMVYLSWQVPTEAPPVFEFRSAVVTAPSQKVEKKDVAKPKRPDENAPKGGRGKGIPGPSTILHEYNGNPIPDVGEGHMGKRLDVLGRGGGGNELGGFDGLGTGSGRGFFGQAPKENTHKIVYIVDRSGSMTDSIDYVKHELRESIGKLDDSTQFHVIFYSTGPALEMATRRLVDATDANKQKAFEFIDSVVATGETDPSQALQRAFAVGADLIYLLTDGEFDKEVVPLVKRLNPQGKVVVNTICFLYKDPDLGAGTSILKRIAQENGGQYKFIDEKELASLSSN
jgi:hypothetical protein